MTFKKENSNPPVCLAIAGLDPSGGAGIVADIKTFTAHGCFAAAVVSSVTFQNTTGVFGSIHQTAESVRRQAEPVFDDYNVAAAKTGMLPTREIIEETASLFRQRRTKKIVVDPVVRSTSGFDLIDDMALGSLIENLFPIADLITPNIPEAERIAGLSIGSQEDIIEAGRRIQALGAPSVLIKGGHFVKEDREPRASIDRLFTGEDVITFEEEYIDTTSTHGTGCTLAAAITANLALGFNLTDSVGYAKRFVTEAIRSATNLGKGHSPLNIR